MGNQSLYSYHAKLCLRYVYWLEIRGIPYLLQRGVDSLSHTAQWAVSVDLLPWPCCKKSYSCGEAYFRSGLFVGLEKKTKIFDQKNEIEAWKNEKKRKFVRGKARFVGPTYSALSLRSLVFTRKPLSTGSKSLTGVLYFDWICMTFNSQKNPFCNRDIYQ